MSCAEFELWVVSDDPAERRKAAEHGAVCPRCAARLAGFAELGRLAADWRQSPPEPSLALDRESRTRSPASTLARAAAAGSRSRSPPRRS